MRTIRPYARPYFALSALVLLSICAAPVFAQGRNVLVIIADDVGADMLRGTCKEVGCASLPFPPTPNIDALAASGVLFKNAWADPYCSPTRATIQAGRYGFRTGVGYVTSDNSSSANTLPLSETIIPEALDRNPTGSHAHAAIGKWHLTNDSNPNGAALGPNDSGYSHYSGALFNLSRLVRTDPSGEVTNAGYYVWKKTVDGDQFVMDEYATADNVSDAIAWIDQRSGPWFLWVAFNAAHDPFHAPPNNLHSYGSRLLLEPGFNPGRNCRNDVSGNLRLCYEAMIEAMDNRIGALLSSLTLEERAQTTVIFVGDNGTPAGLSLPPFDPLRSKGTVYEGGIHVPLIISGAGVVNPGRESDALVNTSDLFATAIELATGRPAASLVPAGTILDAHSLVPILAGGCPQGPREWTFAETFQGAQSDRAIRNARYKLIRIVRSTGTQEKFYDLLDDPFEETDLLGQPPLSDPEQANYNRLRNQLTILLRSGSRCGPCQVSYCNGEGMRCTFNNTCGVSRCCNYTCMEDETCAQADPLPVNACTRCGP